MDFSPQKGNYGSRDMFKYCPSYAFCQIVRSVCLYVLTASGKLLVSREEVYRCCGPSDSCGCWSWFASCPPYRGSWWSWWRPWTTWPPSACCLCFSYSFSGKIRDHFVQFECTVFCPFIFPLTVFCLLFYSILGMHLFGCKFGSERDGDTLPDRKNFDSLLWAIVTVFQARFLHFTQTAIPIRQLFIHLEWSDHKWTSLNTDPTCFVIPNNYRWTYEADFKPHVHVQNVGVSISL